MPSLKLFNSREAAEYLKISPSSVTTYRKQGRLTPYAQSSSGRCMFTQDQLDRFKSELEQTKGYRYVAANGPYMTIGLVAARTGLTTTQLRHWDKTGIFPAACRAQNGERLYTPEQLQQLLRDLKTTVEV